MNNRLHTLRFSLKGLLFAIMATTLFCGKASAQHAEAKINIAAAAATIINPSLELSVSDRSTVNFDYIGAFAKSNFLGSGYPFMISMGTWGYRRYSKESSYDGFFYGAEAGLFGFRMNKNVVPLVMHDSSITLYDVGFGYLFGFCAGYKYPITKRLSIEANCSFGWQLSQHERYTSAGVRQVELNPSAEWLPYKAGIYINYNIW